MSLEKRISNQEEKLSNTALFIEELIANDNEMFFKKDAST